MSEPELREHEIIELAKRLRYDLTACQGKLSDLLKLLGQLDLPDRETFVCPVCRVSSRSKVALSEHIYLSHDGPVPETWLRAEALAATDTAPG